MLAIGPVRLSISKGIHEHVFAQLGPSRIWPSASVNLDHGRNPTYAALFEAVFHEGHIAVKRVALACGSRTANATDLDPDKASAQHPEAVSEGNLEWDGHVPVADPLADSVLVRRMTTEAH